MIYFRQSQILKQVSEAAKKGDVSEVNKKRAGRRLSVGNQMPEEVRCGELIE